MINPFKPKIYSITPLPRKKDSKFNTFKVIINDKERTEHTISIVPHPMFGEKLHKEEK